MPEGLDGGGLEIDAADTEEASGASGEVLVDEEVLLSEEGLGRGTGLGAAGGGGGEEGLREDDLERLVGVVVGESAVEALGAEVLADEARRIFVHIVVESARSGGPDDVVDEHVGEVDLLGRGRADLDESVSESGGEEAVRKRAGRPHEGGHLAGSVRNDGAVLGEEVDRGDVVNSVESVKLLGNLDGEVEGGGEGGDGILEVIGAEDGGTESGEASGGAEVDVVTGRVFDAEGLGGGVDGEDELGKGVERVDGRVDGSLGLVGDLTGGGDLGMGADLLRRRSGEVNVVIVVIVSVLEIDVSVNVNVSVNGNLLLLLEVHLLLLESAKESLESALAVGSLVSHVSLGSLLGKLGRLNVEARAPRGLGELGGGHGGAGGGGHFYG